MYVRYVECTQNFDMFWKTDGKLCNSSVFIEMCAEYGGKCKTACIEKKVNDPIGNQTLQPCSIEP